MEEGTQCPPLEGAGGGRRNLGKKAPCPLTGRPDFTFHTFRLLLTALKAQNCTFQTFAGFLKAPAPRAIILRHDVDARKLNSLHAPQMEAEMGITGIPG